MNLMVDTVNTYQLLRMHCLILFRKPRSTSDISRQHYERSNESLEGHFSGIGVSFYVLRDY